MVVDLTLDSESDTQTQTQAPTHNEFSTSIENIPYRNSISSNPLKRKSSTSTSSSDTSRRRIPRVNGAAQTETTTNANSRPRSRATGTPISAESDSVEVVIPPVTPDQRRSMERLDRVYREPLGISESHFPVDDHERRAAKGAYPVTREVNRALAKLAVVSVSAPLNSKSSVTAQLVDRLMKKLAVIKGPEVTVASGDELALAKATENFQFVNSYQLREGVKPGDEVFNSGCSCVDECLPDTCSCLKENSGISPYEPAADGSRVFVLTPQLQKDTAMIFECNPRCNCKGRCGNAVVQKSRTVRLEIFHTGNRGFGLRSPDPIRAGQFIDRYLGEIVTEKVADKREEASTSEHGHSYLFTLDWGDDDDPDYSPDSEDEGDFYVVDGQKYGTATRFMNHSCSPNAKIIPSTPDHGSNKIYDLAFFATRDIPPMTELTFDYNPHWKGSKKADPNALPCLCGEPNCRQQLWPNTRKGMK